MSQNDFILNIQVVVYYIMFKKETRSVDLWDDWKSFQVPRGSQKWSRMIDQWNGQFIESLSLMHYLLTTKEVG